MAIIPGITPKSPVIGEELNSDNFAITAGQYSVKIDPASVGLTSSPAGLKVVAGTPPADFFRSGNGATLPDGVNDYTEAITHNGNLGIGQAIPPIAPLTFGDPIRNDVIRLFGSGTPDPHQFYGFGINSNTLRYQVSSVNGAHQFYGGTSSSTSKQFLKVADKTLTIGEPLAPLGEGHWRVYTAGDDGYIEFRSPDVALGTNKVQARIYCNGWSGNSNFTGSAIAFETAWEGAPNTPLVNRLHIASGGDVLVSDPAAPYNSGSGGFALLTVNGAIRLKGGAIAPGSNTTRQSGGLVFGEGGQGDTDGGISSTVDGRIDIYCNGGAAFTFAAGGTASKQGGGLWAVLSDVRTKRDIAAHTPNPAATLALEPIEFYYNGEGGSIDDGKRHVGFSAQDLQKTAFSHWVTEGSETIDGEPVRQVDLSNLTMELLGVVKMQQQAIETLEAKVKALEARRK